MRIDGKKFSAIFPMRDVGLQYFIKACNFRVSKIWYFREVSADTGLRSVHVVIAYIDFSRITSSDTA